MRFMRRTLYVLLFLLLIGWVVGWFVGRSLIQSRLVPELLAVEAEGLSYSAQDYSIGGFPFAYVLTPQDALVEADGQVMVRPSAQTAARVSMLGSLFGLATGGPVGARLLISGTHDLGAGLTLTVGNGSTRTRLSAISNFSRNPDWVYAGTDMDLRNVTFAHEGVTILEVDRLRLDMTLLGNNLGHGYDLEVRGVRGGGDTFVQVPDTFDMLGLRGEVRPQINSALLALARSAADNPLASLAAHGQTYIEITASEPGLYVHQGEIRWGDAKISFDGSVQPIARISALSGELVIDARLQGTGMQTLLQLLLSEPAVRAAPPELPALIGGVLSLSSGYGIDLEQGAVSTLSGTLVSVGPQGLSFPLEELQINERALR